MDCHRAVSVDFLQEFGKARYCLTLHRVEGFLVVDECDAEWDITYSALRLQLVYDLDVVNLVCSRDWFSRVSSVSFSLVLS